MDLFTQGGIHLFLFFVQIMSKRDEIDTVEAIIDSLPTVSPNHSFEPQRKITILRKFFCSKDPMQFFLSFLQTESQG